MARVHLSSGLTRHTDGVEDFEIDAPRVRELTEMLAKRFPGLAGEIEQLAVAIDGRIYNEAPYHPLHADTEVYFVPRVGGG